MLLNILNLVGALALLLLGLYQLSNSLQRIIGEGLKKFIPWMKSTPVKGVLSGAGMTASILTSRASTATVISLVSAGIITVAQSVPVIMGANIGTTITAWLITVFGFTINIAPYCFIILGLGFVMSLTKKSNLKTIGEMIIGFSLIFLGLNYTLSTINALETSPQFPEVFVGLINGGFASVLIFVFIGILLSALLQSSSAVVVLTLIMCMSWLDFRFGCALVIGANIGTTITTTLLSSKNFNIRAKQAAVVHFLFNISVAVIFLIFYNPIINIIGLAIEFVTGTNPSIGLVCMNTAPLYGICLFHTTFNLVGTLVLMWFTKLIVKMLDVMFKGFEDEDSSILKYIAGGPIGTAAISIAQAMKEVQNFADISHEGFSYVAKALNEENDDQFEEYRMKLVEYEAISDKLELKIADFLNGVTMSETGSEEAEEIRVLLRIIGELESLGDCGENISRILERERVHKMKFDSESLDMMNKLVCKVDYAYKVMILNLKEASEGHLTDISNAYAAEDEINKTRDAFRNKSIEQIEKREGNYLSNNYFLDFISELEAMGDFMINVSQSIVKNAE